MAPRRYAAISSSMRAGPSLCWTCLTGRGWPGAARTSSIAQLSEPGCVEPGRITAGRDLLGHATAQGPCPRDDRTDADLKARWGTPRGKSPWPRPGEVLAITISISPGPGLDWHSRLARRTIRVGQHGRQVGWGACS